jgi:hypothetical protein
LIQRGNNRPLIRKSLTKALGIGLLANEDTLAQFLCQIAQKGIRNDLCRRHLLRTNNQSDVAPMATGVGDVGWNRLKQSWSVCPPRKTIAH